MIMLHAYNRIQVIFFSIEYIFSIHMHILLDLALPLFRIMTHNHVKYQQGYWPGTFETVLPEYI